MSELRRELGFWDALTIGAGTMIGAGIFLLAGVALEKGYDLNWDCRQALILVNLLFTSAQKC